MMLHTLNDVSLLLFVYFQSVPVLAFSTDKIQKSTFTTSEV